MDRLKRPWVGVLVMLVNVACDDELPSRWATTRPMVMDGQPEEWSRVPLFHVEGHDFAFAAQNDANNLYVYFSTSSPTDQERLGKLGVTVWLNEEGDEEETRGIQFWPTSAPAEESAQDAPRLRHPPIQTVGDGGADIDAVVGEMFLRGNLAYEIRLPLSVSSPKLALGLAVPVATNAGRGKGGAGRGMGAGGMGGGPGMAGGMGRGAGGRGMGPGMPSSGMGPGGEAAGPGADPHGKRRPDHPMLRSEVIWVTVVLSTPE